MPLGSVDVLIFNKDVLGADTLILSDAVACWPPASLTRIPKAQIPCADGVPENVPEDPSVNPVGSCPADNDQVYGALPPDAVIAAVYATPTVAPGKTVVVIAGAAPSTVTDAVSVLVASATDAAATFTATLVDTLAGAV